MLNLITSGAEVLVGSEKLLTLLQKNLYFAKLLPSQPFPRMFKYSTFCLLLLTAVSAQKVSAATVFTSSASFLSNVQPSPNSYTEGFGPDFGNAASGLEFSSNGFTYNLVAAGPEPLDIYQSGDFIATQATNEVLTVNFTSGNVTAVGGNFYLTNPDENTVVASVTLTLSDSTTVSFSSATSAEYRGFVSTGPFITSLVMSAPGGILRNSIDNLTVGARIIPEPASLLSMCSGMLLLLQRRRR